MATDTRPKPTRSKTLPPLRVTDAELDEIKSRAAAAGVSVSAYVRQMSLSGRIASPTARADQEALRLLLAAGRNVNQIAKSGHIHRRFDAVALQETLAEIRAAVSRFLP